MDNRINLIPMIFLDGEIHGSTADIQSDRRDKKAVEVNREKGW